MNSAYFQPKVLLMRDGPRDFQPIVLARVLREHGIGQTELARTVKQGDGRPLSRTSLSFLLNYGKWPTRTPKEGIQKQIVAQLKASGVAKEEIAAI